MKKILLALMLSIAPVSAAESDDLVETTDHRNDHVTVLDLSNDESLTNIDFIQYFPNLKELNLEKAYELNDGYHVVSNLKRLEKLNLAGVRFTTTAPIHSLKNLISLNLTGTPINTVEDIIQLSNLVDLNLNSCRHIRDLEKLSVLIGLEKLNIGSVLIDDDIVYPEMDFLSSLINLKELDLSGNTYLFEIAPITRLPNLIYLNLRSDQEIRDWETLSTLTSLRKLNLFCVDSLLNRLNTSFLPSLINLEELTVDWETKLPTLSPTVKINVIE